MSGVDLERRVAALQWVLIASWGVIVVLCVGLVVLIGGRT